MSHDSLEKRPPGSWYVVVLGDPAHHTGSFPTPDLGHDCVCCNNADTEPIHYDPSSGPFICSPIPIPLCAACRDHARLNEKRVIYIVVSIFAGAGLAVLGLVLSLLVITAIGALVVAGALGVLFMDRRKQQSLSESGHHAGLEIAGTFGICSVRTMNHRVAARLIEKHPGEIHRVK